MDQTQTQILARGFSISKKPTDMIVLVNHETEEYNQLAFTTHESFVTYLCFQYFPKNLMLLDNVNAVRCPTNETLTRGANNYRFSYDYINASDYLAIDDINNASDDRDDDIGNTSDGSVPMVRMTS
ncbi:hypothetical protein ACFE04_020569 [Oxalis oulophora]